MRRDVVFLPSMRTKGAAAFLSLPVYGVASAVSRQEKGAAAALFLTEPAAARVGTMRTDADAFCAGIRAGDELFFTSRTLSALHGCRRPQRWGGP